MKIWMHCIMQVEWPTLQGDDGLCEDGSRVQLQQGGRKQESHFKFKTLDYRFFSSWKRVWRAKTLTWIETWRSSTGTSWSKAKILDPQSRIWCARKEMEGKRLSDDNVLKTDPRYRKLEHLIQVQVWKIFSSISWNMDICIRVVGRARYKMTTTWP